ncbi:MAG: GTP-binding protein [Candidatus Pacebacteria bacterium]|nr:GTP-binding protein [Candidatus Paceibacterota bacterium]
MTTPNPKNESLKRPPIVVVVGHVDHGKTSLLDYIRKSNVAAKEAGGITQSVGAYEILHAPEVINPPRKITFIDTPGHEAFSKMRVRGAHIADVGILVVAADDGVQPQTKEAIKALKESNTPFIVAITKVDKTNIDLRKVKNDLLANNVLLEGLGGNICYQEVSSKSGQGIGELLDLVLLTADMEELTYNPSVNAKGVILESTMDKQRGITVSVILEDGALRNGDKIATASAKGKIRILENFLEKRVDELYPSSPAIILGFESLPKIGEEFVAGDLSEKELDVIKLKTSMEKIIKTEGQEAVKLILKADVGGSLEALSEAIRKIPLKEKQRVDILGESIGEISDGDVKDAISTGSIIIGFRNKINKTAENLARDNNVTVIRSEIIYELLEAIDEHFGGLGEKETIGEFEVMAVFGNKAGKQIIGGKVIRGEIKNNSLVEIRKLDQIIGKGKIVNLQHNKKETLIVEAGKECGILLSSEIKIETEYHLVCKKD